MSQIIHSQILDDCLFHTIVAYFESGGVDASFDVFIDNWDIPESDIEITLAGRTRSLHQKIRHLCENWTPGKPLNVSPLKLLDHDSARKRFIDVVASTVSRAFLNEGNPKRSPVILETLRKRGKLDCSDATKSMIEIMNKMMKRN